MKTDIPIDINDQQTLIEYKKSVERQRGYTGTCFVDVNRLAELHMDLSYLITIYAMQKARLNLAQL